MRILETNLKRLGALLLPTCLRKPRLLGILNTILAPLGGLQQKLREWREETLHRVRYNGQTVNLELCLNDRLDPVRRRIRISDSSTSSGRGYYVYQRGVNYNDMVLRRGAMPCIFLNGRRGGSKVSDFVVTVPRDVIDTNGANYGKIGDPSRMLMTLLDRYKLPSKRYVVRNG